MSLLVCPLNDYVTKVGLTFYAYVHFKYGKSN